MAAKRAKTRKRKQKPLPIALEPAEVEALLAVPNTRCPTGLRNRAILASMYGAGLRVSEVVSLRRGDIRWAEGMVEVHRGKGGRDRNVPITSETLAWFRAWDGKRSRSRWFFCTLQGKRLTARYLQQLVKRLARKAGLERWEKVTPHVLRHTYATDLLDRGFTIRDVQVLLGHSNVNTTQVYTHVRPKDLAAKIQAPQEPDLIEKLRALPEDAKKALAELLRSLGVSVITL